MMEAQELVLQARIKVEVLEHWVMSGWLVPDQSEGQRRFTDLDLARANLIRDLCDLGVNDDGIPIILDLLDQVHGLRRALREVVASVRRDREAPE